MPLQLDPEAARGEDLPQPGSRLARPGLVFNQQRRGNRALATTGETEQATGMPLYGLEREPGLLFVSGQLSKTDDATQVGVAALGLGQQSQVVPIGQGDLSADDGLDTPRPGRPPEAHRPVQAIVIGKGQRRVTQRSSPLDQRLRRGSAVKQGEKAVTV